jgi:hypothetical protein
MNPKIVSPAAITKIVVKELVIPWEKSERKPVMRVTAVPDANINVFLND